MEAQEYVRFESKKEKAKIKRKRRIGNEIKRKKIRDDDDDEFVEETEDVGDESEV